MSAQLDALLQPVVAGVPTTQAKPTKAPWWYEVAARQQLGVGDEWELVRLEAIGERGEALVEGSVTTRTKSGKRTWAKPYQKCITTPADIDRVMVEYEAASGNCAGCGGDGLQMQKATFVPAPVTYVYRTCDRCGGTGKPQEAPDAAQ